METFELAFCFFSFRCRDRTEQARISEQVRVREGPTGGSSGHGGHWPSKSGRPFPFPGHPTQTQLHSPFDVHWHLNPCRDIGTAAMSERWVGVQGGRVISVQRDGDLIHISPLGRPRFETLHATRRAENHHAQTQHRQVLGGESLPAMGNALKHRGSAGDVTFWHPRWPFWKQKCCTHTSSHS